MRTEDRGLALHVYNVMVGHVILQVLSWDPEPQHKDKIVRMRAADGPWDKLTIQIWPIEKKSVNWPPAISLSTVNDVTHYGHFRTRFKNEAGHQLLTIKPKEQRASPHRCRQEITGRKLAGRKMVGPGGLEPPSSVSILWRQKHGPARATIKLHGRPSFDRELGSLFTHGTAPVRICVLLQGTKSYDTKCVTICARSQKPLTM